MTNSHIVYVPGLGDHKPQLQVNLLNRWQSYGVQVHFIQINWIDDEPFQAKLNRVLDAIDKFAEQGTVSVVGVSAGASMALAAYTQRKQKISRVVFICGKLQNPRGVNESYFVTNPAFRKSVFTLPASLEALSAQDKAKMKTFHPYIDTVVPVSNSKIADVTDKTIPAIGHVFAIFLALTVYAKNITKFLKS